MGTSAQERIALSIDSTANTQPITRMRDAVEKITGDTKRFNEELRKNGGDMVAAAKAAANLTRAEAQLSQATQTVATTQAKVNTEIERLSPRLRTTSNAMAILSQAAITGNGSMAGLAVAAGNAAQGVAALSSSARVAAAATGIGAVVAVIGIAIGAFQHFQSEAKKSSEEVRKFALEMAGLARGQDLGRTGARAQALFSGDRFAVRGEHDKDETEEAFRARRIGVQGLQSEMDKLLAVQQDNTSEWDRAQIKIKALEPLLARQIAQHQAVFGLVRSIAKVEGERLSNVARFARDKPGGGGGGVGEFPVMGSDLPGVRGYGQRTGLLAQQGVDTSQIGKITASAIPDSAFHNMQVSLLEQWDQNVAQPLSVGIGTTLADAIGAGITGGFAGAEDAAKAGLGGVFVTIGNSLIMAGLQLSKIQAWLLAHPLFAGPATLAAGIAITALGKALGASARGGARGGGGGGAASGSTFIPNAPGGAGGQTIIIQTIDPTSGAVINSVQYQLNRNEVLKRPIIAPPGRAA